MRTNNETANQTLKYMRNHPGQVYHYSDVAEVLQIDKDSVNAALARCVKTHPEYGIGRLGAGQYQFDPSKQHAPVEQSKGAVGQMFEAIGQTQSGVIIVRGEDGILRKLGDVL